MTAWISFPFLFMDHIIDMSILIYECKQLNIS